jgi:hypothetical protein
MTNTKTCNLMNGLYEIYKSCSVSELREMLAIVVAELVGENKRLAAYCIKETIRRKRKGIWA